LHALFGEMTIGELTFGDFTFGEMTTVGKMTFGDLTFVEVTFGEMLFGKMTFGDLTFGEAAFGDLTFGEVLGNRVTYGCRIQECLEIIIIIEKLLLFSVCRVTNNAVELMTTAVGLNVHASAKPTGHSATA